MSVLNLFGRGDEYVAPRDPGYDYLDAFRGLGFEYPIACGVRCALRVRDRGGADIVVCAAPFEAFYFEGGAAILDPSLLIGRPDCFVSDRDFDAFQIAARCEPVRDFSVSFSATLVQEDVDSFRFEDVAIDDFSDVCVWGEIVEAKPSSAEAVFRFDGSGVHLSFKRKGDLPVDLGEEMAWSRPKRGDYADSGIHFFIEPGAEYRFGFYAEPLAVRYVDAF